MVTFGLVPFGLVTVTFGLGVFGPVIMVTFGVVPLAVIVMLVLRLALIRIVLSAARVAIAGAALVKTLGLACSVTLGVDWALVCPATWVDVWPCDTCSVVCVSWPLDWVCEDTATSWLATGLVCAWAVASWLTALVAAWKLVSWLTLAVATADTLAWALACSVTVVVVTRLAVPSSLSCCKPSPFGVLVSSASTLPWARRLPPAKATIERVVTPIVTQFFLTLCSLKRTLFSIYINHPFFCCRLYSMIYSDKLQIGKNHLLFINLCHKLSYINFD